MGCSAQTDSLLSSSPEAQLPISSHRQRGRAQLTFSNVKWDEKKVSISLPAARNSSCPLSFPFLETKSCQPALHKLSLPLVTAAAPMSELLGPKNSLQGAVCNSSFCYELQPFSRCAKSGPPHKTHAFCKGAGSWFRSVPPRHGQQKLFHHVMEMTLSPGNFYKALEQWECFCLFLTLSQIMKGEWLTVLREHTIDLQQYLWRKLTHYLSLLPCPAAFSLQKHPQVAPNFYGFSCTIMFLAPLTLREVLNVSWGTIFPWVFHLKDTFNPCAPASSAAFSVVISTANHGYDMERATVVIKA